MELESPPRVSAADPVTGCVGGETTNCMKRVDFHFAASDVWLLLAVIIASDDASARVPEIIAVGDGLNHAIFTRNEFSKGLYRLVSAGYVEEVNGEFRPTRLTLAKYEEIVNKTKVWFNQMESLRAWISASSWEAGDSNLGANDKCDYAGFNDEEFFEAIRLYQGKAQNVFIRGKKKVRAN